MQLIPGTGTWQRPPVGQAGRGPCPSRQAGHMPAQPSAGTLTPASFLPSPRLAQDCWFSEPTVLGLRRPKSTSARQPLEGLRSCRLAHCCVPGQVLRTQLQARRLRSQLQGETGRHRSGGGAGVCWDGHRLRHDGVGAGRGQRPAEVSSPRMVRMTALHTEGAARAKVLGRGVRVLGSSSAALMCRQSWCLQQSSTPAAGCQSTF